MPVRCAVIDAWNLRAGRNSAKGRIGKAKVARSSPSQTWAAVMPSTAARASQELQSFTAGLRLALDGGTTLIAVRPGDCPACKQRQSPFVRTCPGALVLGIAAGVEVTSAARDRPP
jgi:hypothetical protein